ncbi:TetR family transcriptional regulator [Subtercola boreus]|uniref:TetR family transcriptional regulator n=1 Tax=Subtercola boreus TaxID=120213 RepID=A0A3E0VNW7_9MICO|nr:TetR/AcrR family transcriptional regulator [Subtercola boreus]RFA11662.1 TetR family transcriptional regulator [Subtercola boreus]
MTSTGPEVLGRRARKKAATRAAISDAALRLFLERGFDNVNVKDIADGADVAVTTLFQHFPSKEALVFDQDEDREKALTAAVLNRAAEQSVLDALLDYFQNSRAITLEPALKDFLDLVRSTPALRDYARRMWTRHEESLARAIAETTGMPTGSVKAAALARFSLDALNLASEYDNPQAALTETFILLRTGWTGSGPQARVG